MALDDDSRTLSNITQKEPAAMGRIKQKALDLGMSTTEFILSHDPQRANQQNTRESNADKEIGNTQINALQTALITLAGEMKEIKLSLAQRPQISPSLPVPLPPAPSDPFASLTQLIGAFTKLREYDNSVIAGYKGTISDAMQFMPDMEEEAEADPFGAIGGKLMDAVVKNLSQPKAAASSQTHNPTMPPPKVEEATPMNPETIAKNTPEDYKKLIRAGNLTLEDAKEEAKSAGLPFSEKDLEGAYNLIKEGKA